MLEKSETAEIINSLRKTKPALVSALEKAVEWHLDGDTLTLGFESGFTINFVRGEVAVISEAVLPFLGFRPKIKLRPCSRDEKREQEEDREVKLVQEVFRGEVVKPGGTST